MSATVSLKSILKPSATPRTNNPLRAPPTPTEARALALTYAHSLALQKALESHILTSLDLLLDYPLPTPAPILPLLRFFTPADYDDLLHERSIAGKCGWVRCANPPVRHPGKSKTVLLGGKWVPRESAERFCGKECKRRALWIRVQLDETLSWGRGEVVDGVSVGETGEVSGLEEVGWEAVRGIREELEGSGDSTKRAEVRELKEELRGVGVREGEEKGLVTVREVVGEGREAVAPGLEGGLEALMVEGYVVRNKWGEGPGEDDDDEEEEGEEETLKTIPASGTGTEKQKGTTKVLEVR